MLSLGTDAGTPKVQKWSSAASSFVTPSSDVVSTLSVFFTWERVFFMFFSPVMKRTGAYFGYLWLALEIIGICSNLMSKALPSISCRQLPHLEEVSWCTNMSWSCLAHQIVLRHTETI
jgi:hypothetical protein